MAGSDENRVGGARSSISQGGLVRAGARKANAGIGPTRRPLTSINQNPVKYAPYPGAASKRGACRKKNAICSEKVQQNSELHRPVTRKFAAQLAAKQQQPIVEEIKQPVQTNCSVIDVDEYKASDSFPEPMSVQDDLMDDEIEMVDADDLDVNGGDKKEDPLDLVEYKDDLYAYHKNVELSFCAPPNYMTSLSNINERMRGILIDWLIEVHHKFEFRPETLYLAVNLFDRFLAIEPVVRKKVQLVGVTAMLIACKYDDVSAPPIEDLILISDRGYTRSEILEMEMLIINKLQFYLSVPTVYPFVKRFLKAAESDNKVELLTFYLIDLCLVEYEMLKFPPSMLAAAALFTAQCTLGNAAQWGNLSEQHTDYKNHELMECSKLMVGFHRKAAAGKLTAVYRKYNTYRNGYAARTEPAYFLLDSSF